jgi:hypothetical protein
MHHVDEGTLHAYLDGALDALAAAGALPRGATPAEVHAHLGACADCRAVLDRERALRGEALALLEDTALPVVDVPAFPWAAERPAPRRRLLPLAWAASLVLATGAGWWGSTALRPDGAQVPQPAPADAVMDVAAADDGTRGAPAGEGLLASAPPAMPAAAAQFMVDDPADDEPVAAAEPPRQRIAAAPLVRDARAAVSPVATTPAQRLTRRDAAPGATQPDVAGTPSGDNTAAQPASSPLAFTAGGTSQAPPASIPAAGQRQALLGRLVPGALGGTAAVSTSGGRPAAGARADGAPPALETFRDLVAAARSGALAWRPATPRDADVAPLLLLERAEVEALDAAPAAGGGTLVRLRQRLADGTAVEVLQWQERRMAVFPLQGGRVPASVVSSGNAAGGGREVLLRVGVAGSYVMITADLDARQLAALADALLVMR